MSKKKKQFTLSELMRNTVEKLTVYGMVLLAFLCLDKVLSVETTLEITITSGLVGAVITMAEVWSFAASLLILFPKNAFLRLMQKVRLLSTARDAKRTFFPMIFLSSATKHTMKLRELTLVASSTWMKTQRLSLWKQVQTLKTLSLITLKFTQ